MKKIFALLAVSVLLCSVSYSQTLVVDEPFASTGLAYTWEQLSSVSSALPAIVADSTVSFTDQDGDGYLAEMAQPTGSTINSYYVAGKTDNITDGKIAAWVYVSQAAAYSGTVYNGVVGRSIKEVDPVATKMYRTVFRTNTQTIRCQSYCSTLWHTIADTDAITTEGWHLITMNIQGTQVDAWDGSIHFATKDDATTIQSELGTLWGLYAYTAADDKVYSDDVKVWTYGTTKVSDWDLY